MALLVQSAPASAGDLKGTIRNNDGTQVTGGWRVVVRGVDQAGGGMALTDDSGSFALTGLAAGRTAVAIYDPADGDVVSNPRAGRLIRLRADGETTVEFRIEPRRAASAFNFIWYRGEYFNDQHTYGSATRVHLPERGSIIGIDMELSPGGGSISGRVTRDIGGNGIPGVLVTAHGALSGTYLSFDRTDENGFYRITGIPAEGTVVAAGLFDAAPLSDVVGEFYDNTLGNAIVTVPVNEGADTPNINFALAPGGSISGRVTAETGGQGLPDVVVTLNETTLGFTASGLTDASGHYQVGALVPGSWTLGVTPGSDYVREYWNNRLTSVDADLITVTGGQDTPGIDLALAGAGRISGSVTHERTGDPLRVLVTAIPVSGGLNRISFTDTTGRYEISRMIPGPYRVRVGALGMWWNSRTSSDQADPVEVVAGQTVTNIDFVGIPVTQRCEQPPQSVGTIRGLVLDSQLEPIHNYPIGLFTDTSGTRVHVGTAHTSLSGAYEFNCLQPGPYFVRAIGGWFTFRTEWYDDADEAHADTVTVQAGHMTDGINIVLEAGGTISGRVTGAGGIPLARAELSVVGPDGFPIPATTDENGEWQIAGGPSGALVAGDYVVCALGVSTADPALVPVLLSRFTATAAAGGVFRLEWTTGSEFSQAGFHVERATAPDGPTTRLTGSLLTGGPDYTFVDATPPAGAIWYWLVAVDRGGREERVGPLAVSVGDPAATRFLGAAANPSRGPASISWNLAQSGPVRLDLFDAAGRWIRTLVDELRPAGAGSAHWEGTTADGGRAAAGQYFLRFRTPEGIEHGRLTIVR